MDWTILCDVSMSKSGRWVASLKDLLRLTWTVVISSRDRKVSQGFLVSQQARLPYISNSKRLQPGTVCLSIFQHCMHTQWFLGSIHLGFLFFFLLVFYLTFMTGFLLSLPGRMARKVLGPLTSASPVRVPALSFLSGFWISSSGSYPYIFLSLLLL